ncbi:MAG: BlaI/MecI/CopY family transcriptional regulator [Parvularcula sp.]|jgi:predicted transcriptional regulator|nr:BlaI/MecI/CopY family transcriptional regulator [Parvularcula sp.]
MLEQLPPRERQIVDYLYERGSCTVADLCEGISGNLSGSAMRAMLSRLERKGFVSKKREGKASVYAVSVPATAAKRSALERVVKTFFKGSPTGAATALLGMADKIDQQELDELEAMIQAARERSK